MAFSPLITQLIAQFCCLPGIGPKSAQRMVFHLLERARSDGLALAKIIEQAIQEVGNCEQCRNLS
jgi:recombination protein RecR